MRQRFTISAIFLSGKIIFSSFRARYIGNGCYGGESSKVEKVRKKLFLIPEYFFLTPIILAYVWNDVLLTEN